MDIGNETAFSDGLVVGMGPERQPCLSVVVKGTFTIPSDPTDAVTAASEQRPVLTEDEYYDGDVTGSVRLEADTVPYKPKTDVVVVGSARAPGGEPVRTLDVSVRLGRVVRRTIRVFGDRQWVFPTRMAAVPQMTDPVPFVEMPLIYERAFGGMDHKAGDWCTANFIGKGYIGQKSTESIDRAALPNLEDPHDLISSWKDRPQPVGFGFFRKNWQPRASRAGSAESLDEADERFGLPPDFEHAFYNGAHPYLQVEEALQGDEEVELRHLTPDEYRQFALPGSEPSVSIERYAGTGTDSSSGAAPSTKTTRTESLNMNLDTVVLLPDEDEFYLVWRGYTSLPDRELDDLDFSGLAAIDIGLEAD